MWSEYRGDYISGEAIPQSGLNRGDYISGEAIPQSGLNTGVTTYQGKQYPRVV